MAGGTEQFLDDLFANAGIDGAAFLRGLEQENHITRAGFVAQMQNRAGDDIEPLALALRAIYLQSGKDPVLTCNTLKNFHAFIGRVQELNEAEGKQKAKIAARLIATAPTQFSRLNDLSHYYLGKGLKDILGNILVNVETRQWGPLKLPKRITPLSEQERMERILDNLRLVLKEINTETARHIGEFIDISGESIRAIAKSAHTWLEDEKNRQQIIKNFISSYPEEISASPNLQKTGSPENMMEAAMPLLAETLRSINRSPQGQADIDRLIDFIEIAGNPDKQSLAGWWAVPKQRTKTADSTQEADKKNEPRVAFLKNPKTHAGAAIISTALAAWTLGRHSPPQKDETGKPQLPKGWRKGARIIAGLALLALAGGFAVVSLCMPDRKGNTFVERLVNGGKPQGSALPGV